MELRINRVRINRSRPVKPKVPSIVKTYWGYQRLETVNFLFGFFYQIHFLGFSSHPCFLRAFCSIVEVSVLSVDFRGTLTMSQSNHSGGGWSTAESVGKDPNQVDLWENRAAEKFTWLSTFELFPAQLWGLAEDLIPSLCEPWSCSENHIHYNSTAGSTRQQHTCI